MYFMKVMSKLYNPSRVFKPRYQHFEAIEGIFYNRLKKFRLISVNGFSVNLNHLPDDTPFRISRFIRDPRDMVISGYFYHKRGAEPWFRLKNPTSRYWAAINGNVPKNMPRDTSFAEYLQSLSQEDGLIAEIEFRKNHFESLRHWPQHEHIKILRYEDVVNNELKAFKELFDFYEVTELEKRIGLFWAKKYSLANVSNTKHVRNAKPGQWKKYFTPKVEKYFYDKYEDIIETLSYN